MIECAPVSIRLRLSFRGLGSRLSFPGSDVKKIRDDLCVLHVRTRPDRIISRARFLDSLNAETCFDQEIEPLTDRPCKPRRLESPQPISYLWWRRPENPLDDLAL